jgi:hypothetical protein
MMRSLGLECRLDARRPHDCRHDAVGRLGGSGHDGRLAGGDLDAGPGQQLLEFGVVGRIADNGKLGTCVDGCLGQFCNAALRRERHDLKRSRVARDEVERALADRAGGAEDGQTPAPTGATQVRVRGR